MDRLTKDIIVDHAINEFEYFERLMTAKIEIDYPDIKEVIFNGPATIVFWSDGTKTVVKHDSKSGKKKREILKRKRSCYGYC